MRFFQVLLNLELSRDGQSHFVELQVHHKLILDFNDAAHQEESAVHFDSQTWKWKTSCLQGGQ